jgi:hypothetical protein
MMSATPGGPSAAEVHEPALVHWCHGAPGAVYLFTKAAEVFPQVGYVCDLERQNPSGGLCV